MSYAEKEGTFTNTERRVQRVRKAVTLDGDMRLDTDIIIDLMNRMGYPQQHMTSAEIMDEIASVTPSYGGISHARLDSEEVRRQRTSVAVYLDRDHPGTKIMHVGKFSARPWLVLSGRVCSVSRDYQMMSTRSLMIHRTYSVPLHNPRNDGTYTGAYGDCTQLIH